jgi:hypothetical protein
LGVAPSDLADIINPSQVLPSHLGDFFFFGKNLNFLQVRYQRENSRFRGFFYPCLSPHGAAKGATMAQPT